MSLTSTSPASSLIDAIGRTPLVRLRRTEPRQGIELYLKLEGRNPGGSVKDRAAARIFLDGLRSGGLRPGKTLLDATSGNTGIAYAMIGASMGYPVMLCVPHSASPERKRILAVLGAQLRLTDAMDGSDGAIREARRLAKEDPERYFYADQYNNEANCLAHYEGTGPEIVAQTDGRLTHFVAGLGTSGTFVGVGRYLRARCPEVKLISVQPDSPLHGIEGLKHMPTAIVPGIYDPALADLDLEAKTEASQAMTRRLARDEGLLVGVSTGAAVAAALRIAEGLDRAVIVALSPDGGEKYLSDPFWTAE